MDNGHNGGAVHLWDIGDKGARAYKWMNVTAGVHVRKMMELEERVYKIVASPTRLMCLYGNGTAVAIVHFDDKK
jgi:hypothetical protein